MTRIFISLLRRNTDAAKQQTYVRLLNATCISYQTTVSAFTSMNRNKMPKNRHCFSYAEQGSPAPVRV
jgi:hypothetical protein